MKWLQKGPFKKRSDKDNDAKDSYESQSKLTSTSASFSLPVHPANPQLASEPIETDQDKVQSYGQFDTDAITERVGSKNNPPVKKDYWQLAVEKLRLEEPRLGEVLSAVQQAAAEDGNDVSEQLVLRTERSQKALTEKQWKIGLGDREIVVRDQLNKIINAVQVFKDFGRAAASLDPIHAGLPWAGLCLIMQLATRDFEQCAEIVAGVEEVATTIARYNEIEVLYVSRKETTLKQEFETRLVALYQDIVKYQIEAACYYQRKTILRFLRSIPHLDDLSDILASVRRNDSACKEIGQVFDSKDAFGRHEEILSIFKRYDEKINEILRELRQRDKSLFSPFGTDRSQRTANVHWNIPRSVNNIFTGRGEVLLTIEKTIRDSLKDHNDALQRRFVITGLGGQGKSEICLKIANTLRDSFWGVFWVDVSSFLKTEGSFLDIAKRIGASAETFEDAREVLANITKSWLLVLDNADNPKTDFQTYFPSGSRGVIIMTSRNPDCSQYATIGTEILEGLAEEDSKHLLLRAAGISAELWTSYEEAAKEVSSDLGFHPLALIQAGSYISRGHCELQEYPEIYRKQRQRLLAFQPAQAQSRYGHVYATFEASAQILKNSSDVASHDALDLLRMLSMLNFASLPADIFQAAWMGSRRVYEAVKDDENDIGELSKWHVSRLLLLIPAPISDWDSYRLYEAGYLLSSLSLINKDTHSGRIHFSMHPLTHAWARDRQSAEQQERSRVSAGSTIALSAYNTEVWRIHQMRLRPHLHSFLDTEKITLFSGEPKFMIARLLFQCGRLLYKMRDDQRLSRLLGYIFNELDLDTQVPSLPLCSLYLLKANNLEHIGKATDAVLLLERIVRVQKKTLAEDHPSRLASQHALAGAYESNGQVKEAVQLLKHVVDVEEKTLAEAHPSRLASQHALAGAYQSNGQVKEAVQLLKHVVKVKGKTLAEDHPDRLASQHALAGAYKSNGQVKEAVQLLNHVVEVEEKTLAEDHPNRLASQHALAGAYKSNGQVKEAVQLLKHVAEVREKILAEDHPDRLASQHALAGAYKSNGQVKEAIQLLKHVVEVKEKTLAEDHPDRLASQHALAGVYKSNGQVKEAVQLLKHVVKVKEKTLAEDHPDRLASQHALAGAYKSTGQVKEAIQLLNHVVEVKEKTLAEDHPSRLASQHALAGAYKSNGQVKEAVQLLKHVVQVEEKTLAEDHPDRLASQHALARAYKFNGQVKEAVQLLQHVVEVEEKTLAEDHPSRLASQHALAGAYKSNGQVKEAVQLLQHVVQVEEKTLAEDHPDRLASQHALAGAYQSNGQVKEGVQLLEDVAEVKEKTLTEYHSTQWLEQI